MPKASSAVQANQHSRADQIPSSISAHNPAAFEDISLHFRCLRDPANRAISSGGTENIGILWAIFHLAERWAAESQREAGKLMRGEVSAPQEVAQ